MYGGYEFDVRSNKSLDTKAGLPMLRWRWDYDLAGHPDAEHVWPPLRELTYLLKAAADRNAALRAR